MVVIIVSRIVVFYNLKTIHKKGFILTLMKHRTLLQDFKKDVAQKFGNSIRNYA